MQSFNVNDDNDIFLNEAGLLDIVHDQLAVRNTCEQYARASRGEMIYKMNRGMPFFNIAFGRNANPAQYEAAFRRRMREIPEVRSVESFSVEIKDNILIYNAEISTIYGNVRLSNG